MARQFIRSVLAQDEAIVASTVVTYDLPVNPLSHIDLTLKFLNDTTTLANLKTCLAAAQIIAKVEVLYKGQAIISGRGIDLAILNCAFTGNTPYGVNVIQTNDYVRSATIQLCFGRTNYDPEECFPAVRRSDLQLQITYAASLTGTDNWKAQYETVELLDATPKHFLKYTSFSKTPGAVGDHDLDLPIGNQLLAFLLFGTTVPCTTAYTASMQYLKLLLDNQEFGGTRWNWETLRGCLRRKMNPNSFWDHIHYDSVSTSTGLGTSTTQLDSAEVEQNYAYMDFDPRRDGDYAVPTEGHARVHLRINAGAADAIRVVPLELVKVA